MGWYFHFEPSRVAQKAPPMSPDTMNSLSLSHSIAVQLPVPVPGDTISHLFVLDEGLVAAALAAAAVALVRVGVVRARLVRVVAVRAGLRGEEMLRLTASLWVSKLEPGAQAVAKRRVKETGEMKR